MDKKTSKCLRGADATQEKKLGPLDNFTPGKYDRLAKISKECRRAVRLHLIGLDPRVGKCFALDSFPNFGVYDSRMHRGNPRRNGGVFDETGENDANK